MSSVVGMAEYEKVRAERDADKERVDLQAAELRRLYIEDDRKEALLEMQDKAIRASTARIVKLAAERDGLLQLADKLEGALVASNAAAKRSGSERDLAQARAEKTECELEAKEAAYADRQRSVKALTFERSQQDRTIIGLNAEVSRLKPAQARLAAMIEHGWFVKPHIYARFAVYVGHSLNGIVGEGDTPESAIDNAMAKVRI